MSLFQNQQKPSGGLFGGGQQQQGGGGGGGSLFSQGTGGGSGGGGGSLFSGGQQQNKTGSLFSGGQQQQGGGGGGSLFSGQQGSGQQSGGGLFSGSGGSGGSGGGLFSQQNKTGSLLGGGGGGGSLFSGQQGTGQSGTGSYSLFGGQKQGQGGSLFSGPAMGTHFPDASARNKYQLSLTNSMRDRKVGSLQDKQKQYIENVSVFLGNNQKKIEALKSENVEIVKKKDTLSDNVYQFSQDSKQLYMKIKQARYLVDEMKSNLSTYEDITTRNFDVSLDLLKGGRLPRLDIPSTFMTNITEFFDLRIGELKDKIGEIEELVKLSDTNEDCEEYEKIIMVLDELYNYYLNVAHKVFQINEYVTNFKAQFIDYFKSQGSREVERIFTREEPDAYKSEILGKLETISNTVLDNKMKKEQEDAKKIQKKVI